MKHSLRNTTMTNMEVARCAFSHIWPGVREQHVDYNEPGKNPDHCTIKAELQDGNGSVIESIADIHWPDGQDKHGSVKVTGIDNYGLFVDQRFACWRNKDGSVGIKKWSEPDPAYQYHLRYGLKWPRGSKGESFSLFIVLVVILVFFCSFLFSVGLSMLLLQPAEMFSSSFILTYVSGLVIGSFLALFIKSISKTYCECEWGRYLKNRSSAIEKKEDEEPAA